MKKKLFGVIAGVAALTFALSGCAVYLQVADSQSVSFRIPGGESELHFGQQVVEAHGYRGFVCYIGIRCDFCGHSCQQVFRVVGSVVVDGQRSCSWSKSSTLNPCIGRAVIVSCKAIRLGRLPISFLGAKLVVVYIYCRAGVAVLPDHKETADCCNFVVGSIGSRCRVSECAELDGAVLRHVHHFLVGTACEGCYSRPKQK